MLTKRCPTCLRTFAATQRYCPADGAGLNESWAGDPRVGQTVLGRYRIEARIGQGGMGVVYRAEQESVGRDVAVKLVRSDRIGDVSAVRRFLREVHTMTRLQSPHTVRLIDAGTTDEGEPCLVMELLAGETLRARLERGPLPWREAAAVLEGVTRAIAEAHGLGLLHRDIKPSNVFLVQTPGYRAFPMVLDFGIAASRADVGGLTGSDEVPGTPAYLAPERITGDGDGPAADVYALGVLGWELCAGRPPFLDEHPHELLVAHLEHDPPPLTDFAPDVPPAFEGILRACLAKSPAERPANAEALLARLAALTHGEAVLPVVHATATDALGGFRREPAPPPEATETTLTRRAGLRVPWSAAIALAVGVGGVIGVQALTAPTAPPPVAPISARAVAALSALPPAPDFTPPGAEPTPSPTTPEPTPTRPTLQPARVRPTPAAVTPPPAPGPKPGDGLVDKLLGD